MPTRVYPYITRHHTPSQPHEYHQTHTHTHTHAHTHTVSHLTSTFPWLDSSRANLQLGAQASPDGICAPSPTPSPIIAIPRSTPRTRGSELCSSFVALTSPLKTTDHWMVDTSVCPTVNDLDATAPRQCGWLVRATRRLQGEKIKPLPLPFHTKSKEARMELRRRVREDWSEERREAGDDRNLYASNRRARRTWLCWVWW